METSLKSAPDGPTAIDLKAPVISRQEIVIAAPLSRVWAVQTNIGAWPDWNKDITTAKLNGPLEAGTVFNWQTAGLSIASTISEVVSQERIVWSGPSQGIMGVHVWHFIPVQDGILVQTEESWDGEPVRAQIEAMQQGLDKSLRSWLDALKQTAEAE